MLKATKALFEETFAPIDRDPSLCLAESQEKKRGEKKNREELMDIKIMMGDRHLQSCYRIQTAK